MRTLFLAAAAILTLGVGTATSTYHLAVVLQPGSRGSVVEV